MRACQQVHQCAHRRCVVAEHASGDVVVRSGNFEVVHPAFELRGLDFDDAAVADLPSEAFAHASSRLALSPRSPLACANASLGRSAFTSWSRARAARRLINLEHGAHDYVAGGMLCHKTATMRALVDLLQAHKRTVRLCAPTGKAARRLTEATGARGDDDPPPARVIARRGLRPRRRRPDRRAPTCSSSTRPRCSRVRLADALLGAVGPRTHVLLVGDADQLAAGRRRAACSTT